MYIRYIQSDMEPLGPPLLRRMKRKPSTTSSAPCGGTKKSSAGKRTSPLGLRLGCCSGIVYIYICICNRSEVDRIWGL